MRIFFRAAPSEASSDFTQDRQSRAKFFCAGMRRINGRGWPFSRRGRSRRERIGVGREPIRVVAMSVLRPVAQLIYSRRFYLCRVLSWFSYIVIIPYIK